MNHLTEQRECQHCGKLFWPSGGHQKYCSKECSCESAKVRDKVNKELYEQNKSMEKYIKEVKKSRKALANISEKAKEEGISYGQYVALHCKVIDNNANKGNDGELGQENNNKCGKRLVSIMKALNLKNRQLSDAIGCTTVHISNIRNGKRNLTRENATVLANYFSNIMPDGESVSAEYLLCETDIANK